MLTHPTLHGVTRLMATLLTVAVAVGLVLLLAIPVTAQSPPVATPIPFDTPTPAPAPASTPAPGMPPTSPAPATPWFGIDPVALLGEHLQRSLADLLATIIRPARDALRAHLDQEFNVLTVTRLEHSVGLPQVQQLHAVARAIANASFTLLLIVGGYNLIFRRHLTGDDSELWPLVGRLLLAALAANTAIVGGGDTPQGWSVWFLQLNNALIDAITRALPISVVGLLETGPLDPLSLAHWARIGPGLLLSLLLLAVLLIVCLLWLLQMLMRLALLDVLLALAPLAMALWVLPQTERWAALWWRLFLPTLFCQTLQVAVLGLATALGRSLALPNEVTLAPLLGIATLTLVLKIPTLLGSGFLHGQSVGGGARSTLALLLLARRAASGR